MSIRLELKELQIALLELKAANFDVESIHIPSYVRHGLYRFGREGYVEKERQRKKREYSRLLQQLYYLRRERYIEQVQEGEKKLYRLTAKGEYELSRILFLQYMEAQRKIKWDRTWRILIFDIPEWMRKYRDHLRALLKESGFQMWQFSVWVTKHNPEPELYKLLKYLGLHKYYALIEADCKKCSPRIVRVWQQMKRQELEGGEAKLSAKSRRNRNRRRKGYTRIYNYSRP